MSNKDTPNMESKFVSLRLKAGVTQKTLADALGVTEQAVRNWERGKNEPRLTIEQTKTLCSLLKVTLDEMPNSFSSSD
jgi:DNA-binding XRE family transcriptional regulator